MIGAIFMHLPICSNFKILRSSVTGAEFTWKLNQMASKSDRHQLDPDPTVDVKSPLRWHHNGHDGVSNHQPHEYLLNCLFRRRSKKTSKPRVTGPLCGEFTGNRWIPRTNGQWRGKCFHLMTSSCNVKISWQIRCNNEYVAFVLRYIYIVYNQWVKLFYLGALS